MEQDQRYTEGFNHGYILAQYLPSLVSELMKSIHSTGSYFTGIIMGKEEYDLELNRVELEAIKQLRGKTLDRGMDLNRE